MTRQIGHIRAAAPPPIVVQPIATQLMRNGQSLDARPNNLVAYLQYAGPAREFDTRPSLAARTLLGWRHTAMIRVGQVPRPPPEGAGPLLSGSSTRFSRPAVAISVADPGAMVHAHSAVEALGGRPRHLSPVQLEQLLEGPEYAGLIYDLAPWNASVVPLLGMLRQKHPALPILLYAPSRPEVSRVLLQLRHSDVKGLRVEHQAQAGRSPKALQDHVQWLLAAVYSTKVMHLMQLLLPDMPARARAYVQCILDRIVGAGVSQQLSVGSVLAGSTIPLRTLQHALGSAGLPPPKALLDWVTLLFATLSADASHRTTMAVARDFGFDTQRINRLRHRLLREAVADISPAQEFDMTFLAFAEACSVSQRTASTVLQRTG